MAAGAGGDVGPEWFTVPKPASLGSAHLRATSESTGERWIVELSASGLAQLRTVDAAAAALVAAVPGVTVVRGLGARGQLLVAAGRSDAAALAAHPFVAHLESDANLVPLAVREPNDPRYASGQLWALDNTGANGGLVDADIDAPEAWALTTGSAEVVVAVIDGGIDISHPDLAANVWTNPGEVPGNGLDDDGNGFVDDVNGWDFANRNPTVFDPGDNDHATHVAGVIAARGDNGRGTVGVGWQTRIMPLKFISPTTSLTSDAIAALNYATMMRERGVNLRITNNSWGSTVYSGSLKAAIDRGGAAGILFVASAGNNGVDDDAAIAPNYPASYESACIVSVAASDNRDGLWASSNYGRTRVDLAAPGVGLVSTLPADGYGPRTGTSMAAATVSGVAALAVAAHGGLSVEALKEALLTGVDPVAGLTGRVATGGRLNAERTVRIAASQRPIHVAADLVEFDDLARIGTKPLVKRGPGTLVLTAASAHAGGTIVEAGEVVVRNLAALGSGTLDVRAGARVTLDVGSANWQGGMNVVTLGRLDLDPAGRIEVGIGQLRVTAGGFDAAAVRAALVAGRGDGHWNGGIGFTSAYSGGRTSRAIGYRVVAGELRLGFAAPGDANLDGQVNQSDVNALASGGKFDAGSQDAGWSQGDFNYDGRVTQADVNQLVLAGLFNTGSYLPPPPAAMPTVVASLIADPVFAAWVAVGTSMRAPKARR